MDAIPKNQTFQVRFLPRLLLRRFKGMEMDLRLARILLLQWKGLWWNTPSIMAWNLQKSLKIWLPNRRKVWKDGPALA